jgi:pilus biogenesis lipoprotein CpaD
MKSLAILLAVACLGGCGNPVARQAAVDTRHDPIRADSMLALNFGSEGGSLSQAQLGELRQMVAVGRRAERDEFAVVSDGSGGALQQAYARRVSQSLAEAGARWVRTSVDRQLATGPHSVVVVRSEYLIARNLCPNYNPASQWNPSEAAMPGFGCADAYNMGQMLSRPRDAEIGRPPGPADGTVTATAIARYREGRVRTLDTSGMIGLPGTNSGLGAPGLPGPAGPGNPLPGGPGP